MRERRAQHRLPAALLLVFVVVLGAMLVEASTIPHAHSATAPGLYNRDHDLQYLALLGAGSAALSQVPAVIPYLPTLAATVDDAVGAPVARPLRTADSRAPPAR
jgi:hypothetical protein